MNRKFFEDQIDRLVQVYGAKYFPNERVKLIWENVKFFKEDALEKTFSNLIGEMLTAPSVSKITDAIRSSGLGNYQNRTEPGWDCALCGQSGSVLAFKKNTNHGFVFRCSCEFGSKLSSKYTREWDDVIYRDEYELRPWADNHTNAKKITHGPYYDGSLEAITHGVLNKW